MPSPVSASQQALPQPTTKHQKPHIPEKRKASIWVHSKVEMGKTALDQKEGIHNTLLLKSAVNVKMPRIVYLT